MLKLSPLKELKKNDHFWLVENTQKWVPFNDSEHHFNICENSNFKNFKIKNSYRVYFIKQSTRIMKYYVTLGNLR